MNVTRRAKDLKALLDIRTGPGATILPDEVRRIHLDFAFKYNDGHLGARRVWRKYLPRLKYHNPAVSMTVNRHSEQSGHSMLTIFFAPSSAHPHSVAPPLYSTSKASSTILSPQGHWNRTETVDMKHKHESEILRQLIEITRGVPYEPSPDEIVAMEEVAEDRRKRDKDRERQLKYNEVESQELALLEHARGSTS